VEGQNIALELRWEEGRPERYRDLADELVGLHVDIIVAPTSEAALAAKQGTSLIPIIAVSFAGDPVDQGIVASLARPGGNITGLTFLVPGLSGKRLELLKETVPTSSRVAVLWVPEAKVRAEMLEETKVAARSLGVQLLAHEVHGADEFDGALETVTRERAQALRLLRSPLFHTHRARIAAPALKGRLPTMAGETGFAEAGGLMNYGPSILETWRRAATYVDKILRGVKPAELPVEQPTTFELGHQPQDRPGLRAHDSSLPPLPGRRGHPLSRNA
jgi:putative tryptophan/tyrosine transport system substrate-binding protein